MSRLKIVHHTGFTYDEPATASYNEARMLPLSAGGQYVLRAGLVTRPAATQHTYLDFWGTRVSTFEVLVPHTELSVTATSLVEVRTVQRTENSIDWAELGSEIERSTALAECLSQSGAVKPPKELAALAAEIRGRGAAIADTALAIMHRVGEEIKYVRGATGVHSKAQDAWTGREGVCQDIAHLAIGALRSVGIPARYVSGYLHPRADAELGEPALGESHAWVEWYQGDWCGYDPTNLIEIGEFHVRVGHGRDYNDVPPLRGVYAGESTSSLFVSVEITREA